MKGFVYILYFHNSDKYYIGSTVNLERRVEQHKRGHTHTTHRLGDFELVFVQETETLEIARQAER